MTIAEALTDTERPANEHDLHPPRGVLHDVWVVARRGLVHMKRQPEQLTDATIQPIMFVVMFAYVFGGAIAVPGSTSGGAQRYREFLMGGIIAQTIVFSAFGVAYGLANDRKNQVVDRFRSVPIAGGAVLGGHALANFIKAFLPVVLMSVTGLVIGWRIRGSFVQAVEAYLLMMGFVLAMIWVGILLVSVFSLQLRWFPSGGFPRDDWADPADALRSLALPIVTIAIVMSASIARYVRSASLDVIGSDYLRNARALGSGFGRAMWRHGLRNGAVPVISVLGIELATTFLGAVVVESVFTLPGLGSMLRDAIEQHDYPNIQGILFVSTLLVLIVGFAADVVQRLVDPRLRQSISGNR